MFTLLWPVYLQYLSIHTSVCFCPPVTPYYLMFLPKFLWTHLALLDSLVHRYRREMTDDRSFCFAYSSCPFTRSSIRSFVFVINCLIFYDCVASKVVLVVDGVKCAHPCALEQFTCHTTTVSTILYTMIRVCINLSITQTHEVHTQVGFNPIDGSRQSHTPQQENRQNHVRHGGSDPHHLHTHRFHYRHGHPSFYPYVLYFFLHLR